MKTSPGPFRIRRGGWRLAGGERRALAPVEERTGAAAVLRLLLPLFFSFAALIFCVPAALAAPSFVAAGTVDSAIGAIAPGMPAGVLRNDILILFLETSNQSVTVSGGTEVWAEVSGSPQFTGAAPGGTRLTAFWARASQDAPTFPTTSDSGNHQLGLIIAIRGATTIGNPWNVVGSGVDVVSNTSGAIPGAATTVPDTLVVAAIATDLPDGAGTANFSAWANGDLTSVTERTDNTASAGDGGGLGVATGEKASAGAYGNTTVTLAAAAVKAMMSIAIKPAISDFTLNSTDIKFSTGIARWNEVVLVSATIQNTDDLLEWVTEKWDTDGAAANYRADSSEWLAQGFGDGTSGGGRAISAAEIQVYNLGTPNNEALILRVTNGTTSVPPAGSTPILASAEAVTTVAAAPGAWLKFNFNEPPSLPILGSGERYHIIAYNNETQNNGYSWHTRTTDVYANGEAPFSTDQGASWQAGPAEDCMFRIYQSSDVDVGFYDGDPDSGGTLIGVSAMPAVRNGYPRVSTMNWTASMAEGYHNIYVHIDRGAKISERSEDNNKYYNTIGVSSAPDAVHDLSASVYSQSGLDLAWHATGDDGVSGALNSAAFIIQYTSAAAWAQGTSWSTDTSKVPAYVNTTEISTTGVAALSQRWYTQTGLLANTIYFSRLWTKDDFLAYSALSNGATASTLAEPVANSQVYGVFYTSVTVNWTPHPASPGNLACEGYQLQASTASNFTGLVYSSVTYNIASTTLTIKSLGTNSTYYFRVASLNWYEDQNFVSLGSTCTLKPPPGAPPYDSEITGVYLSSITMSWTQVDADDGYLVEASTAVDFTGTLTSSKTTDGTVETLTVYDNPPLLANTTYYIRAGALWGKTTSYAATQIATTLATLADPVEWAELNNVFITSAAATWKGLPEEPPWETCEGYRLQASTASDWTGTIYSSSTPSVLLTTLAVAGLSPNVTYYFRLGTLNWNDVANYVTLIATPTLANSPIAMSVISASSYSLTMQWTSGSPANPSGTNYALEASSTNFDGTETVFSSATTGLQATVPGLMSNTTYYLRPKALNWANRVTYGTTVSSASLAQLVSGATYYQVNITSATVNWFQLPDAPSSSTCRGYVLEASTASNFTGELFSSSTITGVAPSTLTVKNLYSETIYYFRVGSYNWNYVPNYITIGSTRTKVAVPPPDLTLLGPDISFSPAAADFGQVVEISASIRNLNYNFVEELTIKQELDTGGYTVDANEDLGQGFVVSKDMSIMAVGLYSRDYGGAGDVTTVQITTGSTSAPGTGAEVLASTAQVITGLTSAWWKFTFNEPARLPVLASGAYWIIMSNPAATNNGSVWQYRGANVYAAANGAYRSPAGAGAWVTLAAIDLEFRIYQSSNVVVSFYDGDPDAGGTFIGVSTTPAIATNKTKTATRSWTAVSPEAYHSIYAYVDKDNNIGESDETNNKAFNSIAISSAPDAVKTLAASTYSTTEIKLTWNPTGDDGAAMPLNNAQFIIQYTSAAAWAQGTSWSTNTATLPSYVHTTNISTSVSNTNTNTYIQTGLGVNATYYFRLWTQDDFGRYSPLSAGTTVCTLAAVPWIPYEPFSAVYFSSITAAWLANGNPDNTQYRLQASTASNFTGDLYGAYIGPNGWLTATSTSAVSLQGCTTYYFRAQARNQASIETDFQTLGSTKTVVYYDCGLRMQGSKGLVTIACQPTYCTGDKVSPLLIRKGGTNWAIGLVDVADPKASGLEIKMPSGAIKAYRKY